jgi:hypothetical protein
MEDRLRNKKILENHELTSWLKTHSTSVLNNISRRNLAIKYQAEIKACLLSDELGGNQVLSINGKFPKSEKDIDVDQILRSKVNFVRHSAGMNLSTLLTENKRNVILQTLQNDCHSTLPSLDVVDKLNSVSEHDCFRTKLSRQDLKLQLVPTKPSNISAFSPNWDHYSVMQSRWRNIRPVAKSLSDGVVEHFKDQPRSVKQRRVATSERADRIILEKIEINESRHCFENHSVRC